jgi:hypothetical protein
MRNIPAITHLGLHAAQQREHADAITDLINYARSLEDLLMRAVIYEEIRERTSGATPPPWVRDAQRTLVNPGKG